MTFQLHISKSEILSFFNKIHKNKIFYSFFSSEKCDTSHYRQKSLFLWFLLEKLWISYFEMRSWDVIFVPFSEQVTCTLIFTLRQLPIVGNPIENTVPILYHWWTTTSNHAIATKACGYEKISVASAERNRVIVNHDMYYTFVFASLYTAKIRINRTVACLWSKTPIFRWAWHNKELQPRPWAPTALIPHFRAFKRGI